MTEGNFLEQRSRSPLSLGVVIVAHAAALTALALSKMEMPAEIFTPIEIKHIPDTIPPPENPPETKEKVREPQQSVIDRPKPPIPLLPDDVVALDDRPREPVIFDTGPIGTADPTPLDPPEPRPLPEPVRTDAQMDPRSELQPDYPAAEERAQVEGSVTVRVLIGTDGRVKSVEKVRAASDAFFRTTERQALRHWRFKPATVDGRPVESRKTITVHFRLDA